MGQIERIWAMLINAHFYKYLTMQEWESKTERERERERDRGSERYSRSTTALPTYFDFNLFSVSEISDLMSHNL